MDTSHFQRLPKIQGDSREDTELLRAMAQRAETYIRAFKWCPDIRAMYLAYGVGEIIALFLVEFSKRIAGTDKRLWIVVGDLPSAYMVVELDDSPKEALERYTRLMDRWISAVSMGTAIKDVFPVETDPSFENADALRLRIEFLRSEVIPHAPGTSSP